MNRKVILMLLILILVLISCKSYERIDLNESKYPIISPFPERKDRKVVIYYPDSQLRYLVTENREIEVEEEQNIIKIIINEFLKGPKSEYSKSLVSPNTKLLSLDVIGDTAYVNFSGDLIDSNLDERNEALLLYSIVNTITEIDTIKNVQILIDGKDRNIFINNYKIDKPLEKSEFLVNKTYVSPMSVIKNYYDSLLNKNYDKAMRYVKLNGNIDINYATIKAYLKSNYTFMSNYNIIKYYIEKYDTNTRVDFVMDINYSSPDRIRKTESFNLAYKREGYKINIEFD
ncbi:GerMN domain-containing protein [Caldisalinibacter kiritimatiensis]|uniref:Spore germination protein n=1 Tax=Caldisalinibacter kiritimatiensis TaxID=1304284 RepID=R1CM59_9FIRM|nr:GerMN domain-containing protein [Caldisalinibacter kiritimatiensis]EOC99795.1 Spore germination protein [Caldisalinibacter kiritimatiensis]